MLLRLVELQRSQMCSARGSLPIRMVGRKHIASLQLRLVAVITITARIQTKQLASPLIFRSILSSNRYGKNCAMPSRKEKAWVLFLRIIIPGGILVSEYNMLRSNMQPLFKLTLVIVLIIPLYAFAKDHVT